MNTCANSLPNPSNWRGIGAAVGLLRPAVRQFHPFSYRKGVNGIGAPLLPVAAMQANRPNWRGIGAELAHFGRRSMTFTTADLARRAGIAAIEEQTPPELIASSRLMVQALMSGVPMAMMLEHLIGSALAVLQLMPDPQAEAENLLAVIVEELDRLELLP